MAIVFAQNMVIHSPSLSSIAPPNNALKIYVNRKMVFCWCKFLLGSWVRLWLILSSLAVGNMSILRYSLLLLLLVATLPTFHSHCDHRGAATEYGLSSAQKGLLWTSLL